MVPNFLHFIWIQGDSGKRFDYGEYLSVVSALLNTTYEVYLHTNLIVAPSNPYDPHKITHSRFHIKHHYMPTEIHGVKARMANLSDIWRIKTLQEYGGIYSDLDIIWFKNLELGVIPPGPVFVSAFENPSYKTAANALLVAEPGYAPFTGLLEEFDNIFRGLSARGITDLTVNPPAGLPKYHTLLWKVTGDFSKANASLMLGKHPFYKNGWRRIGRCLRRAGVTLKPIVDVDALGDTNDRLQLDGITGFHYYATLFDIEQLLELPDFREKAQPVVDYAATLLSSS